MTQLFNSLLLSSHTDYLATDSHEGYCVLMPFEVNETSAIVELDFSIHNYTTVLWSVLDANMGLVSSREQELNYGKHQCALPLQQTAPGRYFLKIQSSKKFPVHQITIY
jgi:hypothetical protein